MARQNDTDTDKPNDTDTEKKTKEEKHVPRDQAVLTAGGVEPPSFSPTETVRAFIFKKKRGLS